MYGPENIEVIAERFRRILKNDGTIVEKQMFGSLGFMVHGKLIVAVRKNDVMFKLGPELTAKKLASHEAEPMTMKNRTMKSWVVVKNDTLKTTAACNDWLAAALHYNFPELKVYE